MVTAAILTTTRVGPHHPPVKPPGWCRSDGFPRPSSARHGGAVSSFELALAGTAPAALSDLVRDRFGEVAVRAGPRRTVLEGSIADQAAVRALLGLVWDLGCEVRVLRVDADPVPVHTV